MTFYKRLGIVLTTKCNAKCKHCLEDCGPHRQEKMPLPDVLRNIKGVNGMEDVGGVTITGGEPFIYFDELTQIITEITAIDRVSHIVTNGFWACDYKTAKQKLHTLAAAGLDRLSISTDRFHLEWVPLRSIENAMRAARSCGIDVMLAGTYTRKGENNWIKEKFKGEAAFTEQEVVPIGRARHTLPYSSFTEYDPDTFLHGAYCEGITTPTIGADGVVYACPCGGLAIKDSSHPLILGNVYETTISNILQNAQQNFLFLNLAAWEAFRYLFNDVRYEQFKSELKNAYYGMCDFCCHVLGIKELSKKIIANLNTPKAKMGIYLRRNLTEMPETYQVLSQIVRS